MNAHRARQSMPERESDPGLRSLGQVLHDLVARRDREVLFPLVHVTSDDYLVLYSRDPAGSVLGEYAIALSDLRDVARVAFWFRQLAPKRWVTARHLEHMAHEIYRLNGGMD